MELFNCRNLFLGLLQQLDLALALDLTLKGFNYASDSLMSRNAVTSTSIAGPIVADK